MLRGLRGLIIALLLMEGVAWADSPALAQARQVVAASDYAAARDHVAAALEAGGLSPDELVELYQLSGTVHAALGDTKVATEAFSRLLVLAPRAALPPGTSPKIRRPFDAAVRSATGRPALDLKVETQTKPPAITLVVVSDPLDMVAKARVAVVVDGSAEKVQELAASERIELALPAGQRIEVRIAALDMHGNRLVELGSAAEPIVILGEPAAPGVTAPQPEPPPPPPPPAPSEPPPRPLVLRWWPYAAATVVVGGATAYFGLSARSDTNDLQDLVNTPGYSPAEADAIEDRARRKILFTNIGLVVTGALAVTSAVMYIREPRTSEPRVAAVPVHGGGVLVLGGNF